MSYNYVVRGEHAHSQHIRTNWIRLATKCIYVCVCALDSVLVKCGNRKFRGCFSTLCWSLSLSFSPLFLCHIQNHLFLCHVAFDSIPVVWVLNVHIMNEIILINWRFASNERVRILLWKVNTFLLSLLCVLRLHSRFVLSLFQAFSLLYSSFVFVVLSFGNGNQRSLHHSFSARFRPYGVWCVVNKSTLFSLSFKLNWK